MPTPSPSLKAIAFARALRRQRRMLDLSQDALASRAGIGSKHLGEIERGLRDPRLTTIIRLLDAFELEPAEQAAFWQEALDPAQPGRR
jgi:predicted transcriptional regulator